MRLLVTGGCGFIGSNFIRHILKKYPEYFITNIDALTYAGNPENLKDIEKNKNYKFIKGDICEREVVNSLIEWSDVVINFAAESHVDKSIYSPSDFVKSNFYGVYALLEGVRKFDKVFIQISTDEVYGSIDKGSFDEEAPLNPSSPYAATKSSADLLVLSYIKTYDTKAVIIRPTNNFGPYQYPEKIIPLFITNALEGKELPIYGDGRYRRNWLYVKDACDGIDLILHKSKPGEIYNLSSEFELDNLELAKTILKKLKMEEKLIKFVKDRPAHDRRYSLDSSKAKSLGWKPKYSFFDALDETIKWYIDNRWWWEPLKKKSEYKNFYKRHYG